MLGDATHLEEIMDSLHRQSADPDTLPQACEQVIGDLAGSTSTAASHLLARPTVCSLTYIIYFFYFAFSALTLLVGRQEGHLDCKKTEWWGAGVDICLERGADLHTAQLMPLPLTVSCFSKIQIGLPFWYRLTRVVGQKAVKRVSICVLFYLNIDGKEHKSLSCR